MSDENAIRVENVSKDFVLPHEKAGSVKNLFTGLAKGFSHRKDTQHALKNVSFEIKKGEFFGIVGRNGSGKSTLLKILAGIYQPTDGRVHTAGKLVPFIELGVGFNPELTGRENVYMNGAMLGFSDKEVDAMYEDIVAFAELEEFMGQKLKNYSSGMQVRLAFSMATRSQADILLIDEVLAVGDAAFKRKCYEYFNQLKKAKKTVIFVSHDMDAVQKYCDRGMLLEKNVVVQIGDASEITEKYLRLFNEQSSNYTSEGQDSKRWGDGSVKIKNVSVKVGTDTVTVVETIQARRRIKAPTIGIRIRSSSGQPITGTNNQFEKVRTPDLKADDVIEAEWQIPNIFSDGKYYVDPAVSDEDGATIAEWWDEAASFTIQTRRPLPYPVDPKIKLSIKPPNLK